VVAVLELRGVSFEGDKGVPAKEFSQIFEVL